MKYLSLSDLNKMGPKSMAPIWVINTADQSRLAAAGEIVIPIQQQNGQGDPDLVHIPQTWLPQEVTRIVPRKRLLNSTRFMRAINDGLISIISEEDAGRLLRQSGAKEETARLQALQKHVKDAGAARTIADSTAIIGRADGVEDDDEDDNDGRNKTVVIDSNEKQSVAALAANGLEDEEPGISSSFRMWADRLNLMKDVEVKNAIKSKASFKPRELAFLQRVLHSKFVMSHKMLKANIEK
jgi:hypothetical protein